MAPAQIALGDVDLATFDAFHRRTATLLQLAADAGDVAVAPFGEALMPTVSV